MAKVAEVEPDEARRRLEDVGAVFDDGDGGDETLWVARHGGCVVECHENGVVVRGDVERGLRVVSPEGSDDSESERGEGNGRATVYFDGASRGNPGEAAVGYVVTQGSAVVKKGSERIGEATNNEAEYEALIRGVEAAHELGYDEVEAVGDSQLVVNQVKGDWDCNAENLEPLLRRLRETTEGLDGFEIRHVPREANDVADGLANEAFDVER
ncbi:MAG: ribonuclease HI family protein [Halobacteria archaeon]|nr:ribonuclease HI family protein [Halobacteria archaeon]